jgi:hypothetical protein
MTRSNRMSGYHDVPDTVGCYHMSGYDDVPDTVGCYRMPRVGM